MAQLAWSLKTGEDWLGLPVNRKPCYFVFTDRSEESNRRPRETADVLDLPWVSLVDDEDLAGLELRLFAKKDHRFMGLTLLDAVLEKLDPKPGSVVILDVMTNAFLGDVHRQATLGPHLRQIAGRALRRKLTFIGTAYGVKTTGDQKSLYSRPIDRIVGAQSMRGSAGTLMYLCHPQEGLDPKAPPSYDQEFWIQSRDREARLVKVVNRGLFELSDETKKVEDEDTQAAIRTAGQAPLARDLVCSLIPEELTTYEAILHLVRAGWRKETSKQYLTNILRKLEEEGRVARGEERGTWKRVESREILAN